MPLAASGAPPPGADPDSPRAQWFRGLKQNGSNASCCDLADCAPAESRTKDGHYEVLHQGSWWTVPDDVVLKGVANPTGEAVACFNYGRLLCFVKGFEA